MAGTPKHGNGADSFGYQVSNGVFQLDGKETNPIILFVCLACIKARIWDRKE